MKEYNRDDKNAQTFWRGKAMQWENGHGHGFTIKAKAKNKRGHGVFNPDLSPFGKSRLQQIESLRNHIQKLHKERQHLIANNKLTRIAKLDDMLDNSIAKLVLLSKGLNAR